jgi:hypothetical protein
MSLQGMRQRIANSESRTEWWRERRALIRAFLRVLDFDPVTRKGVAHFWVVPSVGQDEFVAGPAPKRGSLRTHDQNEDSGDRPQDRKNGPDNVAQTANSNGENHQHTQGRMSSGLNGTKDTRYNEERTRPVKGMSSLDLVAGAGSAKAQVTAFPPGNGESPSTCPRTTLSQSS